MRNSEFHHTEQSTAAGEITEYPPFMKNKSAEKRSICLVVT